jgi:hypothetical protein
MSEIPNIVTLVLWLGTNAALVSIALAIMGLKK